MITDKERETALALLARSRTAVLNAVEGVTEQQARWKPMPERWSILEYIEHLAVSDDALVALVKRSLESPAQPETEEERRAREQKIRATRERTVEYARSTTDDLRSHFAPHSVLGKMDAYQWLCGNARHAETHAAHVEILQVPVHAGLKIRAMARASLSHFAVSTSSCLRPFAVRL